MLLALLSGQRGQTLHLIDIRNVHVSDSNVKIVIGDLLKNSKPGKHLGEMNFPAYKYNENLCIVKTLEFYLQKTRPLRGTITSLFITSQRPYKAISRDTLARWMKSVMSTAGIDISIFKPHSTRSAASSTAHALKIPMATILRTVGWSKDCVFRKFYNKPIVADSSFSEKLLANFKSD